MERKLIDMHMHTCYSDGELTPDELIEYAISRNVGTMAITDHDTINGLKNINKKYDNKIDIYNGIELSAKVPKGTMHILGYDIDINNQALNDKMHELKNNSLQIILCLIEQLKKDYGIIFDYEEIKELINSNHNLGRPDLAMLLLKRGLVSSIREGFDKYLNDADDKIKGTNKKLTYQECLSLIINSGGIPVLAHPKTLKLNKEELTELLSKMKKCGLRGIEVYHSTHSQEERELYESLANEFDLLISGGSDYHGRIVKPDIEVATGRNNNLKIKRLSLVDELKNRR